LKPGLVTGFLAEDILYPHLKPNENNDFSNLFVKDMRGYFL